ncbi:hypothetical protein B0H12DRAFT_1165392 [Mycena haematopus]|nr:hypothetical protein B0H12DRAFT_1165392 [Mycena haematopus]
MAVCSHFYRPESCRQCARHRKRRLACPHMELRRRIVDHANRNNFAPYLIFLLIVFLPISVIL